MSYVWTVLTSCISRGRCVHVAEGEAGIPDEHLERLVIALHLLVRGQLVHFLVPAAEPRVLRVVPHTDASHAWIQGSKTLQAGHVHHVCQGQVLPA